jgi:hypothetical protein
MIISLFMSAPTATAREGLSVLIVAGEYELSGDDTPGFKNCSAGQPGLIAANWCIASSLEQPSGSGRAVYAGGPDSAVGQLPDVGHHLEGDQLLKSRKVPLILRSGREAGQY